MFSWIHHPGNKTVTTMKTFSTLKLQKKKAVKNALKKSTDEEPTPCCGKQVQRMVRLVKKITKSNQSTKRKQRANRKGIKASESVNSNFHCNKFVMYGNIKTYKSDSRKRQSPSDSKSLHSLTKTHLLTDRKKYVNNHGERYADDNSIQYENKQLAYHTHKQASARLLKDIHNLEHHTGLISGLSAYDKELNKSRCRLLTLEKSACNTNKQPTSELLKNVEKLGHHSDLTSEIPAVEISAYHTHIQPTSELLKDEEHLKHHIDLTSVVPANAKTSAYHTHIQATLELLKNKENREHHSDLSSVVPANEIIIANAQLQYTSKHITDKSYFEQLPVAFTEYAECKKYLSYMESESDIQDSEYYYSNQQNYSTLNQREATALGVFDGTASALTALYESELESDTPVIKVYSSSNGTCVRNGIPLMQSTFVFKRNTKAKQEVKFFLFGNNCNQLYTRSAALTKFQNHEISTKDFKILRFLRGDFLDSIEVFETQEPYKVKMNELIQILKQFESDTSQQLHATVPLQPSVLFDSKLESISSLPVDKWTDKVVSQATKNSERAELTSFEGNKTESLSIKSLDKTKTHILKEETRICETLTKTKTSDNRHMSKELALDSDIRKSNSKSRNVSSTHRTSDPMLTSRRKMVDAKVKKTSKYKSPKINIFTTSDDDETGISTVLKNDIVRQAMYGWFNNESKIQFQRPSIPWPSMHPLLPYKLRYLDEGLVDHPVVKTTSSPTDSSDENKEHTSDTAKYFPDDI